MDIGTAKPSAEERASVKHWLVDVVDPSEQYSAFRFAADAARTVRERAKAGVAVMVCGGTGLYFQALARGLGPRVGPDPEIRGRYAGIAEQQGKQAVWELLRKVDPETAGSSHPENLVRNIRALEVFDCLGAPLSELKKHAAPPDDIEFRTFVLELPRSVLYSRIDKRVDEMVERGLWEEFESLRARGYSRSSPGLRCVGYRELFDVEEKRIDLQTAIGLIKRNTRHFAKRQLTWLRHQVGETAADMTDGAAQETILRCVSDFLHP
jgi:tRNA dimethylallyltransferase